MAMDSENYSSENKEDLEPSSGPNLEVDTPQLLSDKLINALMENDVNQLKSLHEAGESFSCCDKDGNTLLHLAIMGQTERSTCTVAQPPGKFRMSQTSRKDAFDYLVTLEEIPKDVENARGASVLMEAFSYLQDDPEWAVKLIEAGCDIHEPFGDGDGSLHWAIENEWIEVAELLIEKGFNINARNIKDETPLYLACRYGLVDEIWMLLFYGADPNMTCDTEGNLLYANSEECMYASCFDIAVGQFVKPEVQEILLNQLPGYSKHFSLLTVIETMKNNEEIFHKLMQVATKINRCEDELQQLCHVFSNFKPELFRIFIEKFDYVILEMFGKCWLEELFIGLKDRDKLATFTANMFTIFESNLVDDIVRILNAYSGFASTPLVFLIGIFSQYKDDVDILTQLLCCMLSYGVKMTADAVDAIFFHFGYCDLFKMMLHMDIRDMYEWTHVFPRIIYDVRLTVKSLIRYCRYTRGDNKHDVHAIFNYFALPKLIEHCMHQRDLYLERKEWLKGTIGAYEDEDDDSPDLLLQKVQKLPVVPCLVELARNRAREYIIYKYKTKNSRQFYTVLNRLPIAPIHREILSYERKLYY